MKNFIIITSLGILAYNFFLIKRDDNLYKAYDACTQFTHHPDCPYKK